MTDTTHTIALAAERTAAEVLAAIADQEIQEAEEHTVAEIVAVVDELAIASAVNPRSRITRPALITMLRESIAPSLGATGSGRGGAGTPLNIAALTLWEDITGRVEALHEDLEGEAPAAGSHEQILLAWSRDLVAADTAAPHGLNQDAITYALHQVTRMRDLIDHHFDPPRVGEILGAACLACDTTTVLLTIDGEDLPAPAIITIRHHDQPLTVHCRACGETWSAEDLDLLERFRWAQRRDKRIHDLATPLTPDDWHHIRLDLREAADEPHPRITWPHPKEQS